MHNEAPQAAQVADLASEETRPVEQTSASTRSSRMSHAGPIGAVLGAGITFGLSLLIQRKKNSSKKAKDSAITNAVGANDIAAKDGVAASSVEAVTSNPKIEDSDTRAAVRDQTAVAGASVAEMEKQLKMLKAAEDENAKLRAFLAAHLQQSEKASALAEENKALKLVKFKLEAELEEAKAQPVFSLATGEDLQLFKGLLAQRMPTGAHSVRSATTADGGASLDGAATVAGLPAVRKNPGFFSDLAQLLMMAPSSSGASAAKPKPVPRTSKAGGLPTSKPGSQAGSVAASSVTGRGAAAKPAVSVDVGKMLDAYSGGLGRM